MLANMAIMMMIPSGPTVGWVVNASDSHEFCRWQVIIIIKEIWIFQCPLSRPIVSLVIFGLLIDQWSPPKTFVSCVSVQADPTWWGNKLLWTSRDFLNIQKGKRSNKIRLKTSSKDYLYLLYRMFYVTGTLLKSSNMEHLCRLGESTST